MYGTHSYGSAAYGGYQSNLIPIVFIRSGKPIIRLVSKILLIEIGRTRKNTTILKSTVKETLSVLK